MSPFAIRRALFGRKLVIAATVAGAATWIFWKFGPSPARRAKP